MTHANETHSKRLAFEGDLFLSILFPHTIFKVEIIQIYGALSVEPFRALPTENFSAIRDQYSMPVFGARLILSRL